MPDFDIDFCQERRGEVIEYVREKYGADRVAQIITFGTLQARAVLRDVGRVLQLPFDQVDKLAKLVPFNPAKPADAGRSRSRWSRSSRRRSRKTRRSPSLFETAQQLEGLYRNASTHAAGIVIGDRPLVELVALYRDPRSDIPATQFNMKWAEAAGLVKFDFLGLKTLTVIDRAVKMIAQQGRRGRSGQNCRWTTPRPTRCCSAAKWSACSRSKARACAGRWSTWCPTGSRT